jgi:[ribosomal protein S5]-alanine N-acetyltransferase
MREHVAIMLRDWSDEDADWYVQQVQDPDILRFTTERSSLTSGEFRKALADLRRNDDALGFVVTDPASGARLANVAATRHGQLAEVSYWVASVARGKGVASGALRALCERVASSWDVTEIRLWTHAENVASQRVAEHAGFSHVPSEDGTREVGGQRWPVRWYSRSAPAVP